MFWWKKPHHGCTMTKYISLKHLRFHILWQSKDEKRVRRYFNICRLRWVSGREGPNATTMYIFSSSGVHLSDCGLHWISSRPFTTTSFVGTPSRHANVIVQNSFLSRLYYGAHKHFLSFLSRIWIEHINLSENNQALDLIKLFLGSSTQVAVQLLNTACLSAIAELRLNSLRCDKNVAAW